MNRSPQILVHGATGHTGCFVVAELLRRGLTPVLAGRDAGRLAAVAADHGGPEWRVVPLDDPAALRRGLSDVEAVVNCAGPFLDTAVPLARAAVETGAHYLDVTAEQPVVDRIYRHLDRPAREAGVAVVPAMAFYGGLADLLVTAALGGASGADTVEVAIGLDHWWPTAGTRVTGARNTATRRVIRGGRLTALASPPPTRTWSYPLLGEQAVVELPFSEVLTIHRHLRVGDLFSYLNLAPLEQLRDIATPAPVAADAMGRSAQRFVVDVVARQGPALRRAVATGTDIYAVSAPIVVEGAARLLDGRCRGTGALAPAQAFDADDLLAALEREVDGLTVQLDVSPAGVR